MARRKKVQIAPKSSLGINDKLKICYNCCFYQTKNEGWCPWENVNKNYNDKCTITFSHWPFTLFRYRFDLPHKLLEPKGMND